MGEKSGTTIRLMIYKGEVLRLPKGSRGLNVKEGTAWMTADGRDHVMGAGDEVRLGRSRWAPVVQAVCGPLVIEVVSANHPRTPSISLPFGRTAVGARGIA
jgi:hypothetical protein